MGPKLKVRGGSQSEPLAEVVWETKRSGEIVQGETEHSTVPLNPSKLSWEDRNTKSHGSPSTLPLS